MKKLVLLITILYFSEISGQNLSTYFLDSLQVIINNDTLVESGKTKVYFFNNTRDTQIVIYINQRYKLVINFKFYDEGTYLVQGGWPSLFENNEKLDLASFSDTGNYHICDINNGKEILTSLNTINSSQNKIFIKVNYRYTFLAPIDTTNYPYPYRQGLWVGRYNVGKKYLNANLYVNYKNDLKDGVSKIIWYDGGDFKTIYLLGKRLNVGSFDLSKTKRNKYRKRGIPEIIFNECNE